MTWAQHFSGLLKTQHVIALIKRDGPMTKQQIWAKLAQIESGLKSKTHLSRVLDDLKHRNQIKCFPAENRKENPSFLYKLLPSKINDFKISKDWPVLKQKPKTDSASPETTGTSKPTPVSSPPQ